MADEKTDWIPTTTDVPRDDDEVLLTIRTSKGDLEVVTGWYSKAEFDDEDSFWCRSRFGGETIWKDEEVLAWMAFPEPYKPATQR